MRAEINLRFYPGENVEGMPWLCKHPDCKGGKNGKPKYALYAKPGEKRPVRCKEHKDDDMIDVVNVNKLCTHPDCKGGKMFYDQSQGSSLKNHL